MNSHTKREFHFHSKKSENVEEEVINNCQWCQMEEEEMLDMLFKEEQLYHPSIHLHALSYTVSVERTVNSTVDS